MTHALTATVLLNRLKAKARFRHLQVLVSLGELASVRGSAEALGLSQPAVTQSLADLERLVDIRLFDRHSRGMRVTRAGRDVLPLARRMLDALAETSEALTAARQRNLVRHWIGGRGLPLPDERHLARILAELKRRGQTDVQSHHHRGLASIDPALLASSCLAPQTRKADVMTVADAEDAIRVFSVLPEL